MKLSELKVDPQRIENGAWVDNIPEMEGLRLKVRGAFNADWRKLQSRLVAAVPRQKRARGQLDPAEQDRVMSIVLRDACLLEWDGIEGDDGQPLPYSKEKATELLTDPQYGKFREAVIWAANTVADQRESDIEEDVKN